MRTLVLVIALLMITSSLCAAASVGPQDVKQTITDYLAGKVNAQRAWWIFDQISLESHGTDILGVDKMAREQKTTIFDLATRIRKDLASDFNKRKQSDGRTKSPEVDPDADVMIAMFRCIWEIPELVRPTPKECGVSERELRKFIVRAEEIFQEFETREESTPKDLFTETCLESCSDSRDDNKMKILLTDEETQRYIQGRAYKGYAAKNIAWLWTQYQQDYLPKK